MLEEEEEEEERVGGEEGTGAEMTEGKRRKSKLCSRWRLSQF